jgi:hypothetical protein
VDTVRTARSDYLSLLRGVTYFVALLVAGSGVLIAVADTSSPRGTRALYVCFGLVIATVLVLLVHQQPSRFTVFSFVFLTLVFVAPATLVRTTWESTGCVMGVPCDPAPHFHVGLRPGIATVLLLASLLSAVAGVLRSPRSPSPQTKLREFA